MTPDARVASRPRGVPRARDLRAGAAIALVAAAAAIAALAAVAFLATGGVRGRIAGIPFSVRGLRKPLQATLLLAAAGALVSPEIVLRAATRVDALSARARAGVAWGFAAIATAAIAAAKVLQHRLFQTSAFDLGLQANVAWNTAHGRPFFDDLQGLNYLGDHFSPIHLALAALYRLWPDAEMLLVLQAAAVGIALVVLVRIAERHLGSCAAALAVAAAFALNPYLNSVSNFDFHPIALAIPIFLWLLDRVEVGGLASLALLAALAATVEETLVPPLVGVGAYLALVRRDLRRAGLALAGLALLLFALELTVLMPYFLGADRHTHVWRYDNLGGDTLPAIARTVMANPLVLVREWLTPVGKPIALASLLASFAFAPLLAPREWILLAIPVLALQLCRFEPQWTFWEQYSAIVLPFCAFASVHGIARLRRAVAPAGAIRRRLRAPSAFSAVRLGAVAFGLLLLGEVASSPPYVTPWSRERVAAARELVSRIPPPASVCAAQYLVPHLAGRAHIAMFQPRADGDADLEGAQFVLVDEGADAWGAWPFTPEENAAAIARLRSDRRYRLVEEREGLLLFRLRRW
ncbi:MAG TPA: DUF2079 domain-containing protein [Candidatus Binatia bacterium]|nr:DUF2079 domain-containing protein [Candidatus Binatia bacterium]